jgi:two-component system, NarL family, nitrate/nitrite response regulator NarL
MIANAMHEPVKVGIIDDHPLLRQGLCEVLSKSSEFKLAGTGANLQDAVSIGKTHEPDIMILDISIPGNGLEAARLLLKAHPKMKIVMFTVSERTEHVIAAIEIGALGYLLKGSSAEELFTCLRAVKNNKRYVSPELAGQVLNFQNNGSLQGMERALVGKAHFTDRESDVVDLLSAGKTNREIADQLHLSEKTVKHHMTVIMEKLNVRNRVEAALVLARLRE